MFSKTATLEANETQGIAMGRHRKQKTKTVRLSEETADLAHLLAGAFQQDVSDFLEPIIRPALEAMRNEAAQRVLGSKSKAKESNKKSQA